MDETRQNQQTQHIALLLVVLGLIFTAVGCYFHWPELTTVASGVTGGGLGLLKGSYSGNTLKAGGGIEVNPSPTA